MKLFIYLYIYSHRLPSDPLKHEIWSNVLKEQKCSHSQYICQRHFHEQDLIQTSSKLKLSQTAVPSIFLLNHLLNSNSAAECFDVDDDPIKQRETLLAEINYWKDQWKL